MPAPYNEEKSEELKSLFLDGRSHPKIISDGAEIIKALLQSNADPATRLDKAENSILMLSILYNNEDLAKFIIEIDSERRALNLKDTYQREALNTPLILAIKKGMYDVAIELIEAGCDLDEVSGIEDYTALHFACALLGVDFEPSVSSPRIRMFHDKEVRAKANTTDERTLKDVIDVLITHGADTSKKNFFEQTPADLLIYQYKEEEFKIYSYKLPEKIYIQRSSLGVNLDVWREFQETQKKFEAELIDQLEAEDPTLPDEHIWQLRDKKEEAWRQSQTGDFRRCADFYFEAEHLLRERQKIELELPKTSDEKQRDELFKRLRELEKEAENYDLYKVVSKNEALQILSEITGTSVVEADFEQSDDGLRFNKGGYQFTVDIIESETRHARKVTHPLSISSSCSWHCKYVLDTVDQLVQRLIYNRTKYYEMHEDDIHDLEAKLTPKSYSEPCMANEANKAIF